MGGKQLFVGPGGAVFVPNCDEQTVRDRLESGEWQKVAEEPKPKKAATTRPSPKTPPPQADY